MFSRMCFTDKDNEYEILFDFVDKNTNRVFIVYTDYSIDDHGHTKLFASVCCQDDSYHTLIPIVSESDIEMVKLKISEYLSDNL